MKKRILGLTLVVTILIGCIPIIASAETSGECGDNVTWTLDDNGVLTISGEGPISNYSYSNSPFYNNSNIKSVIIEDGVTSIGDNAFRRCDEMKSVEIPQSVKRIGVAAFSNCANLVNVAIANGVTRIDENAFRQCSGIKSIIIPDSITNICDYAFCECSELSSLTLGKGIKYIGDSAFDGCMSLNSVYISDLAAYLNIDFYGTNPMRYAKKLYINGEPAVNIEIPEDIKVIPSYAFYGCDEILSVTIPDGVTEIGFSAFSGCSSLKNIAIPDSVTNIEDSAFFKCSDIENITIPNNITSIGGYTFFGCASLESIAIPESVTEIGENAFVGCEAMSNIYYGGSSRKQWHDIKIDKGNDCLNAAAINYKPLSVTTAQITRMDKDADNAYKFNITPETSYENCYVYAAIYNDKHSLLKVNCVSLKTDGTTEISVDKTENDLLIKVYVFADTLQPIIEQKEFLLTK